MSDDELFQRMADRAIERTPVDPVSGLRIYNPAGHHVVSVDDLPADDRTPVPGQDKPEPTR